MKISSSWLHEFLPIQLKPEQLDQILTDTGLEVEGFETVESVKGGLEGVVVAEVVACEKHPNADRLKVTTVFNGTEQLQVVCGAPNVAVGQKVLLAQVGSVLYPKPDEPLKIKASKIREVESFGMLCAEDELGLGTSHDGIMVLNSNAVVGTPASTFLELESDTQLEIGLTPNRADAMGHIGVARDVLAYFNCHEETQYKLNLKLVSTQKTTNEKSVKIEVMDQQKCPRYCGAMIQDVQVKPSPNWLQNKLRAVGLSPINNVVDITNYVMRELGTPLHAFDAHSVGSNVVVRTAKKDEKIITLDGVERTLNEDDLVIANQTEPMCIAGVFGGANSGVSEQTTAVFLEAAYFQPVSIRKTAKKHGLSTDASFRFERGVDIDLVPYALQRAIDLICELTGGSLAMDVVDMYPNPIHKRQIEFRLEKLNALIGYEIPKSTVIGILKSLDFEISNESTDVLSLKVPNYRVDVDREVDVIEEVLRIFGLNQVPLPEKLNTSLVVSTKPDIERLTTALSEALSGMGFHEAMNNSLSNPAYYEKFGGEQYPLSQAVQMLNPLSTELAVMRQSLVFQLLESVSYNQNRQQTNIKFYEFGKMYQKINGNYIENKRLTLVLTGQKNEESWATPQQAVSLFTLKTVVANVFDRLGLRNMLQEEILDSEALFADGYQLRILKQIVGKVGWITPSLKKHFGIKQDVFVADLDWDAILDCLKLSKIHYKELPKTFEVRRDFSLLIDQQVKFSAIEDVARKVDKKLLQKVGLFDVYEGKNLPEGKKSYAVSFTFQDPETTLKDAQIDHIMQAIRTNLETQLGAELR